MLLLMMAFPSYGAELSIQFETIARTNVTAIPGGLGTFGGLTEAPAIDSQGNVAFVGGGGFDANGNLQSGIYTFDGSQYQKVADKNTLVPGGGGAKFTTFYGSDLNDIDAGRVAFRANTVSSGTLLGLYSNAGQASPGNLVELALIDGTEWTESSHPWVDGNTVAMRGRFPDDQTEMMHWDGPSLSTSYLDPGTGYIISPASQASVSGDATIFRRYKTGSSQMVISHAGSIEALATIDSTAIPGQPGLVFSNFNFFPVVDQGGQDAAFRGRGGGVIGVYKRTNDGALGAVADTTTVAPGTTNNLFTFFDDAGISLAGGQVVFLGMGSSFLDGLYTDIGGGLSVIVDDQNNNTINLDGQLEQVSDIRFSSKSFANTPDGYQVVFRAALQSGGTAIIRATISTGSNPQPDISVSGSGTFGDVTVGTSSTRSITISNVGGADLNIGTLFGLSSPFSAVSDNCTGVKVAPSGSCTVSVRFSPTTTGFRSDTLIVPSDDPDESSFSVTFNGTGTTTAAPDISVSGNGAFGDVQTGTSSTHSITVSNVGNANLVMGNLYGLTAPFSAVSDNCSGVTVAPSDSCTVSVRFAPTVTGLKSDTLNFPSNDPDQSTVNLNVNGTGTNTSTEPNITSSGNGAFGDVSIGTSSTLSITVSNIGDADLVINNMFGLAAPFSIVADTCSYTTVSPAGSCGVSVRFTPSAEGTLSDLLLISSNDPDETYHSFSFNGNGTTVSAPNISVSGNGAFGDVTTGTSSTRSVTVSNTGNANLLIGSLSGLTSPFSTVSDNCTGVTVAPAGTCTVDVRFSPTTTGLRSDTLSFPSNDPDQSTFNFAVSGTGTTTATPDISVSGNGAFGDVTTGTSSTRSITINNVGTADLVMGNLFGLASPFSTVSDNCTGVTVAPSGSCTVSVRFSPTTTGLRTDTLNIPSNDPDQSTFNFAVSGTGTTTATPDISVSGNGAFGDVATGTSSTRSITINNVGTADLVMGNLFGLASPFSTVSDNCTGVTVAPSGFCTVSVRFSPTIAGLRSDTLNIPSNDPDQSTFNFAVNGAGTDSPAQEVVITKSDFESGSAGGWILNGDIAVDTTEAIDQYSLRHTKSGNSVLNVSTVGYTGVKVTMNLAATSLDSGEGCYAEVSTNGGSSWAPVVTVQNGNDNGTFFTGTVSPSGADNNSNMKLRFRSTGGKKPDYCWGDEVTVSGISDGTVTEPDITVSGNGSFGNVETGTSSSHSITIGNAGDANLDIGSLYGLVSPFSIVSDNCSNASLAPAASCTLSVRFSPTTTGLRSDTLNIPSNDPNQSTFGFTVNGTGTTSTSTEPDISVSGNGSFGDVDTGTSSSHGLTISNIGDADLVIGNLYGLVTPFTILSNTCSGATLSPAGSCTLSVQFSPTTTGFLNDTLNIPSNDPDQSTFNFAVNGTGTDAPAQEVEIIRSDFEDGGIGNWSLSGNVSVDATLAIGSFSLRHGIGSNSELSVSTTGYDGVSITMSIAASALKNNGGCFGEVSTNSGITWLPVLEVLKGNDNGSFFSGTVSPIAADDNVDLQIRFRADGKGSGGYCYGDDVIVSGTLMGPN